jgi:hypothetical protein
VSVSPELRQRTLALAKAVVAQDPGKEPVVTRNEIFEITIVTAGRRYLMYERDLGGRFPMPEIEELEGPLQGLARDAGISWRRSHGSP